MDLLAQYSDEDDEAQSIQPLPAVEVAPHVDTTGLTLVKDEGKALVVATEKTFQYIDPNSRKVFYNPRYENMYAPVAGPEHPFNKDGLADGLKNHKQGFVEDSHIHSFSFDEQYNTFHNYGYAAEPSGQGLVGSQGRLEEHEGCTVYDVPDRKRKRPAKTDAAEEGAEEAHAAPEENEEDDELFGKETNNPSSEMWISNNKKSPWAGRVEVKPLDPDQLTEEQKEYMEYAKEKRKAKRGYREDKEEEERTDKSFFHGKSEKDYAGQSWMLPPKEHKKENDHTFIPKKWIHTWSGHTKGVSAIRFFPKYGHLLLSASMDSKVKIWDVHNSGKCMRTYLGHSKAIRDITFNNDGSRFLTASWDKNIKLWDTETGQVINTISTGKTPFVVKFHPDEDKQNVLLAGFSDKKIVQFDLNTSDMTQEYDQHLGAVNTITFCDENRRFITTSDDKTIRVWEYGVPVVIKYIADPGMHSMPSIAMHPNGNWFVAQSLDNQIVTYSTKERFRINRKKRFAGHLNAGYACQVNFSPDGRFVISGDSEGKMWFWDWKSHKVFRSFKAHDQVCIGCEWHPLEQSKIATCSWDGLIKYWD
ncbi:hypothetical protein CYMTET_8758 [Cymbomonas tetramitiformis]|uniref:Pre-mRNA-processing factor 17 n=1 Tax=Cymbomonas tetramitiformis TaxID=36881 RepID=A0AAE0LFP4_9CHLO|nr:hypothetical protein CYMTET_8758 [Cymbomonas tetramitiformis]|eukprot:gene10819-12801_t